MKQQKTNGESSRVSRAVAALLPRTTLECIERFELLLGGCRKIESYSREQVVICTGTFRVCVKGQGLCLAFTGGGKLLLRGTISAIEFI